MDIITVRMGVDGSPIGASLSVKPVIGAPLFTTAIVEVTGMERLVEPVISEKEKAPMNQEMRKEEEEPSFLRKYVRTSYLPHSQISGGFSQLL